MITVKDLVKRPGDNEVLKGISITVEKGDVDAVIGPKDAYSYATHPDLDAWLDGGRSTLDPARRKELYAKAQRLIHAQAFWVPMYAQFTIEAVNKRLNYEATPDEIQHVYKATWRE